MKQTMILDAGGKLVANLGGHERVGDVFALEIVVKRNEIQPNLFRYDVHRCAAGQGGIHIHHAGIETIAGIGSHLVFGLQTIEPLIPMNERHEVSMRQLTALRHTR